MKTISIAMATYNGAVYILEQLESLAQQTLLPTELVITDDGSTDDTLAIVEEFAKRSPFPVRVERNEVNIGWKANFMKAASLCKGDYIAFCDQDDVWLPRKLETCVAGFDNDDVLLVYHNAKVVDKNLKPFDEMERSATSQACNPPLSIDPWKTAYGYTLIFKCELLQFNQYYNESADFYKSSEREGHDQWLFFLAGCLGTIYYINRPLVLYRRHEKTVTAFNKVSSIGELQISNKGAFESRAYAAQKRANIMKDISCILNGAPKKYAIAAAEGYQTFSNCYKARLNLYFTSNMISRFSQCIKLLASGGYRPRNKWGVGHKALVRDIICGVLFPKRN